MGRISRLQRSLESAPLMGRHQPLRKGYTEPSWGVGHSPRPTLEPPRGLTLKAGGEGPWKEGLTFLCVREVPLKLLYAALQVDALPLCLAQLAAQIGHLNARVVLGRKNELSGEVWRAGRRLLV